MDALQQTYAPRECAGFQPETLIDQRFFVLRRLGCGGTSSVYKALDLRSRTMVALKVADRSWQNATIPDAQLRALFGHEARMLRHLRTTPTGRFHAAQLDRMPYYIAVDYLAGETLADLLQREPLAFADRVALGLAITACVMRLHAHVPAVAHLDIKPGNLFLTDAGDVILLDLGSARWLGFEPPGLPQMVSRDYAAPEQQAGAQVDQRADQYALGVLIGELMGDANQCDALCDVIRCATALLPAQRYRTVADFYAALGSATATNQSLFFRRWWWRLLLVVVACLVVRLVIH